LYSSTPREEHTKLCRMNKLNKKELTGSATESHMHFITTPVSTLKCYTESLQATSFFNAPKAAAAALKT